MLVCFCVCLCIVLYEYKDLCYKCLEGQYCTHLTLLFIVVGDLYLRMHKLTHVSFLLYAQFEIATLLDIEGICYRYSLALAFCESFKRSAFVGVASFSRDLWPVWTFVFRLLR